MKEVQSHPGILPQTLIGLLSNPAGAITHDIDLTINSRPGDFATTRPLYPQRFGILAKAIDRLSFSSSNRGAEFCFFPFD